eukprot:TRINITY_DN6824_c0_g1_i4.p1 TRINITY_DN6824_c0_g1~~TRINITY_DN6824_c0_g1_i4.p1  ORF type:complete len:371 (+),score=34.56 TRINITY_DN6824_c0_g1_i4:30-1142(+)
MSWEFQQVRKPGLMGAKLIITTSIIIVIVAQSKEDQDKQVWQFWKAQSLALSPLAKQVYVQLENDGAQNAELQVGTELCKKTQRHGFQERKGILTYDYMAGRNNKSSMSRLLNVWHEKRHQTKEYVPPFFMHSCIISISHKYKFIYIGIPKIAYRSTSWYFKDVVCNETDKAEAANCFQKINRDLTTKEEYTKYFNEYFKFAFVRNPYSRAASAYYMMAHVMQNDEGERCAPRFGQHCLDPYKLKELCGKHYQKIKTSNQTSDCCCRVKENKINQDFLDQHFMPQAPCIFDCNGNFVVDYVGRFEHYEEDLAVIMQEINKRSENKLEIPEKFYSVGGRPGVNFGSKECDYIILRSYVFVAKFCHFSQIYC